MKNEEKACQGAAHRAGYQGLARCDLHEFVQAKWARGNSNTQASSLGSGSGNANGNGNIDSEDNSASPPAAGPVASEFCTGFGSCSASPGVSTNKQGEENAEMGDSDGRKGKGEVEIAVEIETEAETPKTTTQPKQESVRADTGRDRDAEQQQASKPAKDKAKADDTLLGFGGFTL